MPAPRNLLKVARVARATYRAARVVAGRLPWRLAVFAVLALCASYTLLATAPSLNEFRDAQVLGHYETVARDAIVHWHQAPLWDPYYCGGMYLLGTPQARFASPTFLLTLLFGEQRGEALAAFTMMIVGLEGAFRYARSHGARGLAALLAAPVFALSGIFALSPSLGWISFFSFELLPWIALGVRRSLRREVSGVVLSALAMAWCVGMGGTYAAPIAALWGAFEGVEHVGIQLRRREWSRLGAGIAFALAAGLLSAGLAAVRLWPVADTLADAPRIIGGTPANSWIVVAKMLFAGPENDTENGSFFIGLLVLPALALGLLRRRSIALTIILVICAWLAMGYAVHPSLFAALRELPLYTTLRYPERFLIPFALAASALSALGMSRLEARVRLARRRPTPGRARVLGGLLALAAVALAIDVGPLSQLHAIHAESRHLSPPPVTDASRPFHQSRGNRWALSYYEPMQRGSLSCWEAYPVPQSPMLRADLAAEETLMDPGAGTVTEQSWSPDAIDLDVDVSRPTAVVVNQNWSSGWRASVGEVQSIKGLLTVAVPAGKQTLSLRFRPRSATGGALTSLAAAAALGFLVWWRRRHGGLGPRGPLVLGGAAVAPLLPLALVAALVHEPRAVEPPVAHDGRPVVVDAVPPGTPVLGARFASGVVLEGARISSAHPVPASDLVLELDWRRDAVIDKGLGIFMHIEASEGKGMNGDHVLLSSVLDLEDAPSGKVLRDVMPLWVPEDAKGKTFKVWVGLWRVRRGGERVHLDDRGQATADGDRVLAATFDLR
jgi:hypothetical protein